MNGPVDTGFWVGTPAAPDSYRLISLIGSGGEGEVWEAVLPLSTSGRRTVAVKILPPCADPSDEVRWLSHGHLLRSLAHPGLVRVTDHFVGAAKHRAGTVAVGEVSNQLADDQVSIEQTRPPGATGGCRYVVMDLAEGVTLREWIEENPDARPNTRLRLLAGVAAALDEMHSGRQTGMPVAHGDVKPGNIIVGSEGSVVLVDLGLTRLTDGPGTAGRSLPYAAPELRDGGQSSVPADRFAFYATAAHLLTGETPPVAKSTDVDLAALTDRFANAPATATRPALADGILSALSAPPYERPGPLSPWLQSLTDTLSQRTEDRFTPAAIHEAARQPVPTPRGSRLGRRGVVAIAVAAAVLIGGGGGAAALTLSSDSSKDASAKAPAGSTSAGLGGGSASSSPSATFSAHPSASRSPSKSSAARPKSASPTAVTTGTSVSSGSATNGTKGSDTTGSGSGDETGTSTGTGASTGSGTSTGSGGSSGTGTNTGVTAKTGTGTSHTGTTTGTTHTGTTTGTGNTSGTGTSTPTGNTTGTGTTGTGTSNTQPETQSQPQATHAETAGGNAHTWTNYTNAGGAEGALIPANTTVQIACKITGFRVSDGNTWWYRIASSPWNNSFYVSADAFYNNGGTSGSLAGTPWYDPAVPDC